MNLQQHDHHQPHKHEHKTQAPPPPRHKVDLHVEALIHPCCTLSLAELESEIQKFLDTIIITTNSTSTSNNDIVEKLRQQQQQQHVKIDLTLSSRSDVPQIIQQSCMEISIHTSHRRWTTTVDHDNDVLLSHDYNYNFHIYPYTLTDLPSEPEEIEPLHNNNNDGGGDEEPIIVCETLSLPHASLHTSWENLIFPQNLKNNLLNYAQSALLFSQSKVNSHIIGWNRVLLLYGPPGTGKTSLCRALAHKLSIRLSGGGGYLLEIQSHSLFSKWFSESGKLISRMFGRIREMVQEEPDALFFVLMDEVESLASSRVGKGGSSGGGSEPSDSIRAVNSLLTSLDSIRHFQNVMILSTSNITDCVDGAFVDRVDWMVKVDLPCLEARYEILRSCLEELRRVGIVKCGDDGAEEDVGLVSFHEQIGSSGSGSGSGSGKDGSSGTVATTTNTTTTTTTTNTTTVSGMLMECARLAEGLSGRSLRKIPFQSHAFHVHSIEDVSLEEFLHALKIGIERKVKGDI